MKQLIFNPDKDMKELEKYGFGYTYGDDWHINIGDIFVSRGDNNEFSVYFQYSSLVFGDVDRLLLLEYDLIKANLLIVEEKDV